jgi:orotidine-5'-phosphate decarboxylase
VIDAVCEIVPAVKPQMAFYESLGPPGIEAFIDTVEYARGRGLIVVEDAKRNDIGTTALAYASGHLGKITIGSSQVSVYDVDAITVNPYLGYDGIEPFVRECERGGKGMFVLARTSNTSSEEFQGLAIQGAKHEVANVAEAVAAKIEEWGRSTIGPSGYSSVGAVVGATFPQQARRLRQIMPHSIFLVPGIGAQGGTSRDVVACYDANGCGALVSSSRSVIYAWHGNVREEHPESEELRSHIRQAAIDTRDSLNAALTEAGKQLV